MKKQLLLLALIAVFSTALKSQVAEYFFNQQSGTYTPLATETVLWSGSFDDAVQTITIPAFTINGQSYTSLAVSSNGFITFGDVLPSTTTYYPISVSTAYNAAVSAFGLRLINAGSGTPKVSYNTNVSGEIVVQWQDVKRQGYAGDEVVSFQIRLNPATQVVKLVYGSFSTNYTSSGLAVQVGLRGASSSDYINRTTTSDWSATTAGINDGATCRFNTTVYPAQGLTFLWKPLYNPTSFTATAMDDGRIDLSWIKNEFNHEVLVGFRQANATIGTPVNGTAYTVGGAIPVGGNVLYIGNGTEYSHTELAAGTQYHYKIWSYDGLLDYSKGSITNSRTAYPLPYLQPFNSMPAEWTSNMSVTENHGTAGSSGLQRRFNTSSTTYYAISPLVGSITSDTRLSFHYRIVDFTGFPAVPTTLGPGNKIDIEVSLNDGATYTTFHTIDHTNHAPSTEFSNKVLSLSPYASSFIKVRFTTTWASGDYYVNIDNVLFEVGTNMSYSGATTEQPNTGNVGIGSENNDIIRLIVVTNKPDNPLSLTSIKFNTTGSTNAASDIAAAKVFYTTGPVFSTATQFGSTLANPSGIFTITGNQTLLGVNNYFWLAYDIKPTANAGNNVDAQCVDFITSDSPTAKTPWTTNPGGVRKIGTVIGGVKTIPGDYETIAAAVTALNNAVVGSGGVTFNVAAGHTESIATDILLTATGTSSNPIVFQKSGAGSNPLVTRTGSGSVSTSGLGNRGDGIIIIQGGDYITFDAIDVTAENAGIEYGYYLRKASTTDGCKHVTIKNCSITMTKGTSASVVGFHVSNNSSGSNFIGIETPEGAHSNITFTGNTISNVFTGIYMRGHTTFYDNNITIGSASAPNIIQNFAGNTNSEAYGIFIENVHDADVGYNTINNTAGGGSPFINTGNGIYNYTIIESAVNIHHNNINLTSQAATSFSLYGIRNRGTGASVIAYNAITLTNTASTSAAYYFVFNNPAGVSTAGFSINNNSFAAGTLNHTGLIYLIYSQNSQLSPSVSEIKNNTVNGTITRTGASGTFHCYYNNGTPTGTEIISGNNFSNIIQTGSSPFNGIYSYTFPSHTQYVYDNIFSDITGGTGAIMAINLGLSNTRFIYGNQIKNISSNGTITGINSNSAGATTHIYKNLITNISSSASNRNIIGINSNSAGATTHIYKNLITNISSSATSGMPAVGIAIPTGIETYVYNNFISDLRAPVCSSAEGIRAISITSTTANSFVGIYYNTIYLGATSSGATFGTSGLYHTASATPTTATLDMRNNIIVNKSTANGSGFTTALRRSSATQANFSEVSNNNILYAGTPGPKNVIYRNGTNYQTIDDYKAHVTPRETNSLTEDPPFVNTATAPFDLHLQTNLPTLAESTGQRINSPIAVDEDFDGDLRSVTTPDIGADEFNGLSGFVSNPASFSASALGSQQNKLEFVPNDALNNVVIVFNLTGSFTLPAGEPTVGQPLANGTVLYIGLNSPFTHSGLTIGTNYYYRAFSYDGAAYSGGIPANATPVVDGVTNFTALAINQSQINLSWNLNAASNQVMIAACTGHITWNPTQGAHYEMGFEMPDGCGTIIYKGPAEAYNLTSLPTWAQYFYKIWSYDSYDFYSAASTANAVTYAEPVTSIPYLMNFDGPWSHLPGAPYGWNVLDLNGSGIYTWVRSTVFSKSSPASARGYDGSNSNDYLISPPIVLPSENLTLSWWDRVSITANNAGYKVLLSTTNKEIASFNVELGNYTCTNVNWEQRSINLSTYSGQTVFIAFHLYFTNNIGQYFMIDDVLIETQLPGPATLVGPMNGLKTFNEPKQLSWLPPASSTPIDGYKVYFGTNPSPTALVYNGSNTTWSTGELQFNTSYYWKVIPYSTHGDAPDVPVWSFSTVTATQLAESFENDWFPPVGWDQDITNGWFLSGSTSFHGSQSEGIHSAGGMIKMHTPKVAITSNSTLSFFALTTTSIYQRIQVFYSVNKGTWLPVGNELVITPGGWQQYTVDLSALAGNQYFLGFAAYFVSGGSGAFVYVDHVIGPDVVALLPQAAMMPNPENNATWVLPNTTISWWPNPQGGIPTAYKVYLGTNGGGVTTPTNLVNGTLVSTNSYNLTSLNSNTTYFWKIIPTNSVGDAPDCPIWSFSTFPDNAIQIGFGDEDWMDLPIDANYSYSYTQSIYLQQEIGVSRWITKIAYHWDGYFAAPNSSDWVIYLGHTTKTSFAGSNDWVPTSQMLKVFDGMVNIPAGPVWIEIELDTPFLYNNTDNLVIAVDENTSGWDSGNFLGTPTEENRSIGAYDDWNNYDPDFPPSGILVDGFPNTRLFLSESGPAPQLGVNPMLIDFGFVMVDEESEPQTISITNIGGGLLLVNSIILAGDDMDDFELTINNTLPLYMYTYDNYEVEVTFKPLSKGNKTASLLFVDNTAGKAITEVELYGFGEPIDPPQSFEANTQGLTSILLEWEKNTDGHDVMIATSTQNNIVEPVDGTEYLVGDDLPGGGVLVYKGPLESFLHSGLVSGAAYYYKAWSVTELDKYSISVEAYASTFCNQLFDIPIVENFDDLQMKQLPLCWRRIIGQPSQWGYHWIGASQPFYPHEEESSLTFYNSNETDPVLIAVTPELNANINTLSIRFRATCPGRKSSQSTESITVGVLSDPTDASTFVPQKTFFPLGLEHWTVHEHYFNDYVGDAKYIGIKANFPWWAVVYIYVDDIVIDYLPTCFKPIELSVSNITYNSVDFSWQAQSGETTFEVRGGPTGFDVENHSQGFTYSNISNTTLKILSLEHSTMYDLYVRAICGPGDASEWAGPIAFNTLCLPMAVPVEENFDDYLPGEIPLCWSVIENESSVVGVIGSNYYSAPHAFALWNQSGLSDGIYLISPELSGNISTMYMKFFAKRGHTVTPVIIGTMSDHTDGSTFQASFTQSLNTIWQQYTLFFNDIPEDHHYIAFKVASYGFIDLDDIIIDLAETCLRPTHLRLESAGSGSATLSWLPGTPGDDSWEIKYGQPGFNPADEGNLQSGILSVPYTLINLNPSTSYHAYVRTVCGLDVSVWTGPLQFTTFCSDEDRCNYSVIMTDSAGDGWDGTVLGFKQNGVIVGTFGQGFTSGSSYPPVDVPLCPDLPTQIVVVELGSYTQEKGFSVYDPDGQLIFQRTPGNSFTSSTIFYTFTPDCGTQIPTVPENLTIESEVVQTGQIKCYNAQQVITVAGGGKYFVVQNGATARLIAGQKIIMLPGTHFQAGSYGHAFIDLSGQYCSNYRSIVADFAESESVETPATELSREGQFFKVFPNPTTAWFTLELNDLEDNRPISVEIYSMLGENLFRAELQPQTHYLFDLSAQPTGLYLIRVMKGDKIGIEKMIRQ